MARFVLSIACLRFLPAFYSHAKVEIEIVLGLVVAWRGTCLC
jgi:hypothetical protein